jgi:translocation and assembly module TamB
MSWKKILGWAAAIIGALIVVIVIAGFFALRSNGVRQWILAKVDQKISTAIGGQVDIQNFALHFSPLRVDAYGIIIHGTEPRTARPLAQADQLAITLKIVSLLHAKVDLKEIVLHHPVVNVVARKDGTTNLPHPPQSNSQSSTNVWDLGIKHVLLDNGEVYYNDLKTPLDADLHDLRLEVRSKTLSKDYDGTLTYRDGHLKYGAYRPLPHDLNAKFTANPSTFTLNPLVLSLASSTFELKGSVQNYSQPAVDGTYRITMHPQDFRAVLKNPDIPTGEVVLAGKMRYQSEPDVPLMRTLYMDGQLNSRELSVNSPSLRTAIRNLAGQFRLANGNLEAHSFAADVLGGHLIANATMLHMDTKPVANVRASLQAISLDAAKAAMPGSKLGQVPVRGTISGTTNAAWTGSMQTLKAQANVILNATLANAASGSKRVPLNGAIHVNYAKAANLATFTNTFVRTPQTSITVNGTAGNRMNVDVQLRANDLRELDTLVAALQSPASNSGQQNSTAASMNLAGAANANLLVRGTMDDPQIQGNVNGRNLQVQNTSWRSLQLGLQASKRGVSIQNGSVVNARQGYLSFALTAGLTDWKYEPANPINVQLTSRGLAIDQLLQVAKMNYQVSGNLSADVSVHGSQLNPVGSGSIKLVQAQLYGQPLQNFSLQFNGDGNAVNSTLNASMPAGALNANVVLYPKTKGYDLRVDVPGVDLAKLQPVQERNLGVIGVVKVSASGRGTFDNPQLNATVEVPQLTIRQASLAGIKAQLNVANKQANVALDSEVARSYIQARGTVKLTDGYYTQATFDTRAIPLEGLLALVGPVKTNGPTGLLEVHASVQGPLKNKNQVKAHLTIPTLTASYQGLQIGNKGPIRVRYANSVVTVDPSEIAGTDTDIRMQGQLPIQGNGPVTLSAVGAIDMKLLRFFQSDIDSSGKVALDVRATGAMGHPTLGGQIKIQNVSVLTPTSPLGLENLNGVLDIHNDQLTITQLTGQSGGGTLSLTGVVGYRPTVQMNIAATAKHVRIRYQDAIRTVVDSKLNLVGTSAASTLSGRVVIDSLGFTQSSVDLTSLAGAFGSGTETAPPTGFEQHLKLNIGVQSSQNLNVASSTVSLQGNVNLRVIGTAADPVITGRTDFTAGDLFLMNKRFQIQRGIIEFDNPTRTEPVLNVLVTTVINQYNVSMNFLGPLDKMRTTYISDPPLPTADVINLLARGQTLEQAEATPSNFGATSLVAQGVASQLSSGVQKLAGLSSFSIDPTLGGNDPNPGARIAMQKKVTKNFFFTFATDVTSAQRELIQGEYKLSKRWSTTVTRDENGGFAVDGKFHTTF